MIIISRDHAEQLIDLLHELNSQNQSHYDHFRPGELSKKEDEIYKVIAYLEMGGEDEIN